MTDDLLHRRASGVLLHPTSLPGGQGIGDLGPTAFRFVDFLAESGQSFWQVLPLGPVAFGHSPYQSPSAFAGNPLLISLDQLLREGWLKPDRLADAPDFPEEYVDFPRAGGWKLSLLEDAWRLFEKSASPFHKEEWKVWCADNDHWLDDYSLFAAIKEICAGKSWVEWPHDWRSRDEDALRDFRETHAGRISFHRFAQWQFFRQWDYLRKYAHEQEVHLIGDLPIFVAHDSADVWTSPDLYELDEEGRPMRVAGVPPDYFSETGQRWGNPLFRWERMKERGYVWWKQRFRALIKQFDLVRIDHFRGFARYWAVPAEETTAVKGSWEPGPGQAFFEEISRDLGGLPVIAEDLGMITAEVNELRKACGVPGMKVLQFAFTGDWNNPFLPHLYEKCTVVYTGTHDNNTTRGWWREIDPKGREQLRMYLGREVDGQNTAWQMIRLAWLSPANLAIAPLQDLLNLGGECRMNLPGTLENNWQWRCTPEQFERLDATALKILTELSARA